MEEITSFMDVNHVLTCLYETSHLSAALVNSNKKLELF